MALSIWHSGLTAKRSRDIERVQKTTFIIILGDNYIKYEVACTLMSIEPLAFRRESLCLKFAKKDNSLFNKSEVNTCCENLAIEPKCNTKRFRNSFNTLHVATLEQLMSVMNHPSEMLTVDYWGGA